MKIKSLHEIYISYKLFETIGFHNQGTYDLSAQVIACREKEKVLGYPQVLRQKKPTVVDSLRMSTLYSSCIVDEETCTYHSPT